MCVNFQSVTQQQLKISFHTVNQLAETWKAEIWQDYATPIIVGDKNDRHALLALYSMIPKKFMPQGTKRFSTMNARAETIGTLRSYAKPWRQCQFCLVPMMAFYEPNYESGKAERWKISMADGAPFAVAGLYRVWAEPNGEAAYSFTQITVNADDHPLMRRFHKPGDEKRSLVIIPTDDYDNWLSCRDPEEARTFLTNYPAELLMSSISPKAVKAKVA